MSTIILDLLYQFLTAAPEENQSKSKRWYVKYQEGAVTPLPKLKDAFRAYMKFKHPGIPYTWPEDESALKSLGYIVKKNIFVNRAKKDISKAVVLTIRERIEFGES